MVTGRGTAVSIDERILQELKTLYQQEESKGNLFSRQQLAAYYATFRNKFGPEKLASLDGETLLETMHSHGTKDSLVYWLEFKNDEEFPAGFGSIAGGSAYKFGLFRKKETGIWTTGAPLKPVELSVEQAVELARQHRDQLIKGAELLERLPDNGSDEQYAQLQLDMQRVAPLVYDTAWGHKYFSLLYPEKLDDFHNPDYARFHLIKMLQLPPQSEGRYVCAGRYVAIAQRLEMPLHVLSTLLNERDGRNLHSYWRIGTAKFHEGKIQPREYWPQMRDGNFCAIGWPDVGDLSSITRDGAGKQNIRAAIQQQYPDYIPTVAGKAANQLFDFRHTIDIGDLVLASDGATVLGIGRVTGEYRYNSADDYPHQRPVEWLSLDEWKQVDTIPAIEGQLTTVYKMKKPLNLIEAEKHVIDAEITKTALPILTGIMSRIQTVLERKGQVILYGPPGTGKTYWAERAANELAARSCFNRTFGSLTNEQKTKIQGDTNTSHGNVRVCCFHPAYGYEDFLEGLRPEATSSHMQFVPRSGIFKQLCLDASAAPQENFYLIIDELNRGDVPRIFGELLTVLEKDKRHKPIILPLTQEPFHVPLNVFIIGTMNTADRSIALLDTALRRRFGFIELMPASERLNKAETGGIPLGPWLDALNSRIRQYVGRDARNLQIGHAYLMEKGQPIADLTTLARIVQDDILPLLEEYCYEDYGRLEQILGSGLVDSKTQSIRHELFEPSRYPDLVQALLAPSPDITTSASAAAAEAEQEMLRKDQSAVSGEENPPV
ncbi:MAG TPA: AAA family ATPase [Ktedonobacteraceae bacterium]|jgi:5-methylcytosine-specific restriction enzyme B